jgi:hypothetical protein
MRRRSSGFDHSVLAGVCLLATTAALHACGTAPDIHDTQQVRSQACVSCHQSAYAAANDPQHVGSLPNTCNSCHNTKAWTPATVTNHPWFLLQNKHAAVACASCHTTGYNQGQTPNTCVGCHQKDYDGTTSPPHTGLPATCSTCHNDSGWSPSTFQHPWTLDGAHVKTPCVGCHTGTPPRYPGTPTACVGCHLSDYQGATYNGHNSFPQTCPDCHNTTAWSPASGGVHPEALFPITTGSHSLSGTACIDCHNPTLGSPVKGANTVCISCHLGTHQRPAIDSLAAHTALGSAYPGPNAAQPNFCLGCHPSG